MKHIKKVKDYSIVCGMGAVLVFGLVGCEAPMEQPSGGNGALQASQKQGAFVIIEEVAPKQYKIADEYPASKTTVILRKSDGTEKILSKAELDALIKEESAKIDNGTSQLTDSSMTSGSGGMGLGATILASVAGGMLGSYIGSKLFNNQNFQNKRKASYKNPSTYSRSKNSFNKARANSSSKRGNFMKKRGATISKRRGGFFGRSGGSRRFGG